MTFVPLTDSDVEATAPIDDTLMGKIQGDLNDLNSRVTQAGSAPFKMVVEGRLSLLNTYPRMRSLGSNTLSKQFSPSICRFSLKKSGISGALAIDLRKHTALDLAIIGIISQFTGATQSVGRVGSSLNIQSISRAASQLATQTISFAKATANIQSILALPNTADIGPNAWQINVDVAFDADLKIGDFVTIASADTSANNGLFPVVDVGRGGGANVVVTNVSGAPQYDVNGTVQPMIISYNYTNPVSVNFAPGYQHHFNGHTNSDNDGDLLVYAINQSGNNIWVKNSIGVTQGSTAGTCDTNWWKFSLSSPAPVDYAAGESALTQSCTTGGNDGTALPIVAVNSGGNNVWLYIATGGAAQAGAAGTIDTNRWAYGMPSDPSSQVTLGDTFVMYGHTSGGNDGTFLVKEINNNAVNNLVVYNINGVVQSGTTGNVWSALKLVNFAADESANFTLKSFIEMVQCASPEFNSVDGLAPFPVLQINRGGGANYNIVIFNPTTDDQLGAGGQVIREMKSIFISAPTLAASAISLEGDADIVGETTSFDPTQIIPDNMPIGLYLTNGMVGEPKDFALFVL